jgi:hypothetical protein
MDALAVTTAILTLVLVLITAWYAVSTRHMVTEMRDSRRQAQRPAMALDLNMLGPQYAAARITNAGTGTAFDVALSLEFELGAERFDRRPWEAPVVLAGAGESFLGPEEDRNVLSGRVRSIRLVGTVRDSLGETIQVDAHIPDLIGWWERRKAAGRLRAGEGEREREQQVIKALEEIVSELRRMRPRR